ncbi:MAG: hypothetical protein HC899_01600 [Leptolyngbyaceae cyanobacterium SM1_4_3]|nr:hypothetical protein [Leptolyngbyaceae cyanobacterium SM1_4_3]
MNLNLLASNLNFQISSMNPWSFEREPVSFEHEPLSFKREPVSFERESLSFEHEFFLSPLSLPSLRWVTADRKLLLPGVAGSKSFLGHIAKLEPVHECKV